MGERRVGEEMRAAATRRRPTSSYAEKEPSPTHSLAKLVTCRKQEERLPPLGSKGMFDRKPTRASSLQSLLREAPGSKSTLRGPVRTVA